MVRGFERQGEGIIFAVLSNAMPAAKTNKTKKKQTEEYIPKPWYKNSNTWGWICLFLLIVSIIVILAADVAADDKAKALEQQSEELRQMGIRRELDGSGDWVPDPDIARRAREYIQNGGYADPQLDAIQDGDYQDLLDQMGGPEGF